MDDNVPGYWHRRKPGCQFHDPNTGEECGMEPAGYGVTYAMGDGYLKMKVCLQHWEYYLCEMEHFIADNEDGWKIYLKAMK